MSRLYVKTDVDTHANTKRRRAHRVASAQILWGSKSDPKVAVEVTVVWDKAYDKPTVWLKAPLGVEKH